MNPTPVLRGFTNPNILAGNDLKDIERIAITALNKRNVHLLSWALVPKGAHSLSLGLRLGVGFGFGLIMGLGLVLGLELGFRG